MSWLSFVLHGNVKMQAWVENLPSTCPQRGESQRLVELKEGREFRICHIKVEMPEKHSMWGCQDVGLHIRKKLSVCGV